MRPSSSSASSDDSAARYGCVEIIPTYALQAWMIRDASGMSSPASPSGYPVPSQFSCDERTMLATLRSAGDARRMRSPTIVCWRTKAHSRSSSGPGFWRISSGTATLPRSWSCAACSSSSSRPAAARGWSRLRPRARPRPRAGPAARARGLRAPPGASPSPARSRRGESTSARTAARPPPAVREWRHGSRPATSPRRTSCRSGSPRRLPRALRTLYRSAAPPLPRRRSRSDRTRRRRGGTRHRQAPAPRRAWSSAGPGARLRRDVRRRRCSS